MDRDELDPLEVPEEPEAEEDEVKPKLLDGVESLDDMADEELEEDEEMEDEFSDNYED